MTPKRIAGLALLVAGSGALYFGIQSSDSAAEQLSEALTGRFTDETMAYLIGGAVAAIVGLALLIFGRR